MDKKTTTLKNSKRSKNEKKTNRKNAATTNRKGEHGKDDSLQEKADG